MTLPAARLDDETAHGGKIVEGDFTVLIGGSPAARVGDSQTCPLSTEAGVPHVGGAVASGSSSVYIGGKKAARLGDSCDCTFGPKAPEGMKALPNTIATGETSVLIG